MTARFMSNTPYANVEFEMQRVPGFSPRGSGMRVSRLEYSVSSFGCQHCVYKSREKKCDIPVGSTCFRERLVEGCVPLSELLEVLTREVPVRPFVARVLRLSRQQEPLFENEAHRQRFEETEENGTSFSGQTAALFLLTADPFLWSKAQPAVALGSIDFSSIRIHGVDLDGYVLFHTAKDLYKGTKHISLSELTDPELVSDSVFRLLITAFLICRYGTAVVTAERS